MMVTISVKGRRATAALEGEVDHCSAQGIRRKIEEALCDRAICELIVDFSAVNFMDSSGVGMLIGRYRTMERRGGVMRAVGLNAEMNRLFRLAGLHRIISLDEGKEAANE